MNINAGAITISEATQLLVIGRTIVWAEMPLACGGCRFCLSITPGGAGTQVNGCSVVRTILSQAASHIFICHSSRDEAVAHAVVQFLEAEGLKCWISLRDVAPGQNYQEAIVGALDDAMCIVFLFSEASSGSGEIKKELSLAGGFSKPVFPLRLSPVTPSGALRYELAIRQWIDIFPDRNQALRRLVDTIRQGLQLPGAPGGEASPAGSAATAAMDSARGVFIPATVPHGAPTRGPVIAPGSEDFEAIRAILARYIGPIAKVIVQKASAEALTMDDLLERLASRVSLESDRAAFLRELRARLAKS